ncbi:MAG: bifunctional 5,10-methylenetetrahydrofolate dehydrogenase/5,10-methenyltetrahydrofolate cyclohydrolase, partial [Syntrophomonadaceae bacterium]|nr:bifunctional 5,10-methylenetetrahydrofolate dehydrogenase/5,10-methenyltetrahydrofolate cyclohydrolase [Syntrophomonadaceae bacterium]
METRLVDGAALAAAMREQLQRRVAAARLKPHLAIITAGQEADTLRYVSLKERAMEAIGGRARVHPFPAPVPQEEVRELLAALNRDPSVHGILLQLPLPGAQAEEVDELLAAIAPHKDVDGFGPVNRGRVFTGRPRFTSCAVSACLQVLEVCQPDLRHRRVALLGDSWDLVLPLAVRLALKGAIVQVVPPGAPWQQAVAEAVVVVAEHGHPGMIKGEHLHAGAGVIDCGFHWADGRVRGNVDTASVTGRAAWLAPVPGGIGPL